MRATASLLQSTQLRSLSLVLPRSEPTGVSYEDDMFTCSNTLKTNGTLEHLHITACREADKVALFGKEGEVDSPNAILRSLIGNRSIRSLKMTTRPRLESSNFWKCLVAFPEGSDVLPLLSRMKGVQRLHIEDGSLAKDYRNALELNETLQHIDFDERQ
jgi:hypothetical protein